MRRLCPAALARRPRLLLPLHRAPRNAQEATIPDTIVTGTRIPTPAERVPAAVTVLTRRDIEERGYQTPGGGAGHRAGPPHGPARRAGAAGHRLPARRQQPAHVLVLLDGVPVNDPSEPNGAFNFGNELLFDVERIEVVRGPASALYGSAALGGVVNLVTRRAPPDRAFAPYGEVAGGTQRTLRGGLGATGTLGAFDYLLSGAVRLHAGLQRHRAAPAQYRRARRLPRRCSPPRGSAGRRWRARASRGCCAGGRTISASTTCRATTRTTPAEDRRWYGQLRGETRLFDGIWTTGLRLAATEDRRRYMNLPDALSPARPPTTSIAARRTTLDWGNTAAAAGVSARCATARSASASPMRFEESRAAPAARPSSAPPWTRSSTPPAGYATLQYRLLERLDMTAGLRHDATTGFTDATTWRLGAVLALPEMASRLRASAGTAFAAPSLFQRFGVIGSFFRGNPDLRPERSFGWEVGAETDIPAFGRAGLRHHLRHLLPEPHPRPDQFQRRLPARLTNVDRARHPGRGARPDLAPRRLVRDDGGLDDHRRLRRRRPAADCRAGRSTW